MALFVLAGCGVAVKYSLSGASIPPDAKTFSVAYFPNNATMVSPILSSTLTERLGAPPPRRSTRAATSPSRARLPITRRPRRP